MIYDNSDEMVGTAEAARILGISQQSLRKHSRSGNIPCKRILKRWRYSVEVLEAIAEGRPIPHEHTPPLKEQIPAKDFSGDHHGKS